MQNNAEKDALSILCDTYQKNNAIDTRYFEKFSVKRGLRNADGSGVMAGLTNICNVHGYVISEGEREPDEGRLIYRGIDVTDLTAGCVKEQRFGFEEVAYLLLLGKLPDKDELARFNRMLADRRNLPGSFSDDNIIKVPSPNIMNSLARSVLALYSYDENPDDISLPNVLRQSMELIARLPTVMVYAYQVQRRHYNNESMVFHPLNPGHSVAEAILSCLRDDRQFTAEEARLLDLCLLLHAEHGGGNNSTFACRVLSSSNTDTYSAVSSAIGSLKGPRHGGANIKVCEMLEYLKSGVKNWDDDDEIAEFLRKIIRKEEGDRSGLIYGMGHAVYTLSDPRAVILKENARTLAENKGLDGEFRLLEAVERLTPSVFAQVKGGAKTICANVDLYSGLVYRALGIPADLFTPIFAIARITGWCAHRLEEIYTGGRIIRPAYKSVCHSKSYIPLGER